MLVFARTLCFSLLIAAVLGACGEEPPPTEDDSGTPPPSGCTSDDDCADGLYCNGDERCDASSPVANRFGCVAGTPPCETACDEVNRSCAPDCPDEDGDGHAPLSCGGDDCDDTDADRYPGNLEVCDAADRDEDCDLSTFGTRDADEDRFVDRACCNGEGASRVCGLDCDDAVQTVNPVVPEVCNGFDDNCNGETDEDCGCAPPGSSRACGMDGPGRCLAGMQMCEGGTWTACTGVLATDEEYLCDGQDENCNGQSDEGLTIECLPDADADGHPASGTPTVACPDLSAMAAPRFGCPVGSTRADRPEDCCDADAAARPQVLGGEQWFGEPTACGDYDYDCDGSQRGELTAEDRNPACGSSLGNCRCLSGCGDGWQGSAPACGETGRTCVCGDPEGACGSVCTDRVQRCR
ncbi:MAG: putative metal-binding motif-containing protein [Sandaracinaceae bacterium]